MKNELRIYTIQGIPIEYFDEFKEFELDVKIKTEGIQNEWTEKVIEYIIISTLVFPIDFLKDILKDQSKLLLVNTINKIVKLWQMVKGSRPAIVEANKEPNYKEPKLRIVFPISESEDTILELGNSVSDDIIEKSVKSYFDLLNKQFENRIEEEKLKTINQLNIKIKQKNKPLP